MAARAWLALEDVEADAGPLFYHAGSHRQPILGMREVGIVDRAPTVEDYERHYEPVFAAGLDSPPRAALLKKGQALVWAANLAHGGTAITREGATAAQKAELIAEYQKLIDVYRAASNGMIDDGLSRPCSTTCGSGREVCAAGAWGACAEQVLPSAERCGEATGHPRSLYLRGVAALALGRRGEAILALQRYLAGDRGGEPPRLGDRA